MLKSVTGMQGNDVRPLPPKWFEKNVRRQGFSLIEILVVLVILGITMGFVLLAFGDFGEKRRITATAEQFQEFIKLVQEQAVMETGTLGIRISPHAYEALRFTATKHWQPLNPRHIFHHQLMNSIIMNIHLTEPHQRIIVIQSTGEMTPFDVSIGTLTRPTLIVVHGSPAGTTTLSAR